MTIVLPTDSQTEQLARRLAEATGKPLPIVVQEAIEAMAAAVGLVKHVPVRCSREELLARMIEITDRFADLPVLDARTPDEIIGYDEFGVPR